MFPIFSILADFNKSVDSSKSVIEVVDRGLDTILLDEICFWIIEEPHEELE